MEIHTIGIMKKILFVLIGPIVVLLLLYHRTYLEMFVGEAVWLILVYVVALVYLPIALRVFLSIYSSKSR
jgi:hypothetical protein